VAWDNPKDKNTIHFNHTVYANMWCSIIANRLIGESKYEHCVMQKGT
jgi:hypothetical protein